VDGSNAKDQAWGCLETPFCVQLWDFETGEQKETIGGFEKEITSISFIETGDDLLTSSGDGLVRLGERHFRGAQDFLYASASSADAQTIIAGGQDGVLRVWHADGTLLQTLGPPDGSIQLDNTK